MGHLEDDLPSQSFEWPKNPVSPNSRLAGTSKPHQNAAKLQHERKHKQ